MGTLNNQEESVLNMLKEGNVLTIGFVADQTGTDVKKARLIMQNIVEKSKNEHFSVTYYVSGVLKDGKGIAASVINKSQIQMFKDKLEKVLSEHIYAIHNTSKEIDPTLLQAANENKDELCLGCITLDNVSRRKIPVVIEEVEVKAPIHKKNSISSAFNSIKPKETDVKKPIKEETVEKNQQEPLTALKNKSPVKAAKKSSGIAGLFAKQNSLEASKKSKPVEEKQSAKNNIPEDKKPPSTSTKKNDLAEEKPDKKSPSTSKNKKNLPEEKQSMSKSTRKNKLDEESEEIQSSAKKGKKEIKSQKSSSKKTSDKWRRIVRDDSDEENDDIFESASPKNNKRPLSSDDEEDVIPATPEEPQKLVLNSRKRKKMVDRTFMKDGFFVTVKEEVFENCSDEEEVENKPENTLVKKVEKMNGKLKSPEKQKIEPKKSKKSPPVVKGKQSNLMSFFKKESK